MILRSSGTISYVALSILAVLANRANGDDPSVPTRAVVEDEQPANSTAKTTNSPDGTVFQHAVLTRRFGPWDPPGIPLNVSEETDATVTMAGYRHGGIYLRYGYPAYRSWYSVPYHRRTYYRPWYRQLYHGGYYRYYDFPRWASRSYYPAYRFSPGIVIHSYPFSYGSSWTPSYSPYGGAYDYSGCYYW